MKLFLTKDIKELDTQTTVDQNIKSIELMERAASAAAFEIMKRWNPTYPVIIFAGPGNNGGDALAIARIMTMAGYRTVSYLFNPKSNLSEDCEANRQALSETPEAILFEITTGAFNPPKLDAETLVIDGLFGTGLNAPIEGGYKSLIKYINDANPVTVAIDIPSGLFGEDNTDNFASRIIKAKLTLTFQFPKLAFLFAENEKFTGEVVILDINLSAKAIEEKRSHIYLTEKKDILPMLRTRMKFANKGDFGKALLIAGSRGMMGAAVLAAKGCMRNGAGLLTVHSAESGRNVIQSCVPEAKFDGDDNSHFVTEVKNIDRYTAVAIGPGLGTDSNTAYFLRQLLQQSKPRMVLDADALNLIAQEKELLGKLPSETILTPHPTEFDRLFDTSENSYRRYRKAIEAAMRYNIIIVLKGAYTAVVLPSGAVYFNTTGNAGMATAGSGDVLTGMILSLLAQGYQPQQAAILGVYLHGLAGDLALEDFSEEALMAGDIPSFISKAYKMLRNSL